MFQRLIATAGDQALKSTKRLVITALECLKVFIYRIYLITSILTTLRISLITV